MAGDRLSVKLDWKSDHSFEVKNSKHSRTILDGSGQEGPSPMEGLLAAVAGCMSIDVLSILEKGRTPPKSLEVEISGERKNTSPKYFTTMFLKFILKGKIPEDRARRAIELSFDKYCSVFHSLRSDLQVNHELEIWDE